MAGDWIKVRDNLIEDPAVGRIATALGIDKYGVVGRLIRVWTWADQQSRDGHAAVTHMYLDELVSTPGMADAMVLVGWLEVPENGQVLFPKFDRHMSKSAKKRALATRRKQVQRSHAPVTLPSRKSHAKGGTREEKSISNKHLPVTNSTARSQPLRVPENPESTPTASPRSSIGRATPPPGFLDALPTNLRKAFKSEPASEPPSFEEAP